MPVASQRDPRSVVTPDAFEVSPDLLGMPLAAPSRRLVALGVDGLVILLITALTRSLPLLLGVASAAFFIRAGFKRIKVRGSVFGRAMRLSVGCLGVFIAILTASLWAAFGPGLDRGTEDLGQRLAERAVRGVEESGLLQNLEDAATLEDARETGRELAVVARLAGLDPEVTRTALAGLAPDSASWRDAWIAELEEILVVDPDPVEVAAGADDELREEIDGLSDAEAIDRWAAMTGATGGSDTPEEPRSPAELLLEARVRDIVAGDSLATLERRAASFRTRLTISEDEGRELAERVDRLENRGVLGWLLALADAVGFGFGWAALYLTVIPSWWNGQSVGKRALGIRVVRLDGGPITWWVAFERVGGYAAGFATGLLGFAQVWWDANRQAIHDRIVGTVVIDDGAERVLDWESSL